MKTQSQKEKPTQNKELRNKKSIRFRRRLNRIFSVFDKHEDWAEIQTEEDISKFTAEGPYYEIDQNEES